MADATGSSTGFHSYGAPSKPAGVSSSEIKTSTESTSTDRVSSKLSPKALAKKLLPTKSEPLFPSDAIDQMFAAPSSRNQYKGLSDQVGKLAKNLRPEERQELYDRIEEKFRLVEHEDSNLAWIQRGDLLDAIDVLVDVSKGELKPMRAEASTKEQPVDATDVPLVPYKQMKAATKLAKTNQVGTETLAKTDMRAKLKPVTVLEHSKAAASVRVVTSRNFRFESFMNYLYRGLTAVLGEYQASRFLKSADSLASMSRGLQISSAEFLTKKELNSDTKEKELVGYYRGPKFLFGRSVHQYFNRNDWFKRSLTPEASAEYLTGVEAKEAKLAVKYGAAKSERGDTISQVVVANSDSRVRYHTLEAGKFGETQELTGKVLSAKAERSAAAKQDDPAYYAEKYEFSTKNLVGRENDDSMKISDPRAVIEAKLSELHEKIHEIADQISELDPEKDSKKIETLKHKMRVINSQIVGLNSSPELYVAAQHELLGGLWRTFDRHGATQVVQRLAPADVHNYVAPLNGKPLSHKEACEVLKKRMETRLEALKDVPEEERKTLEAEIAHFEKLVRIFDEQEHELGRASQATIDIYGTNESVSTPAISNKSSILAQNDRKVMMFLHEDGSFSMHVFIGATGVNKVDVDQQTADKMQRGDRQGDMQFGGDRIEAKDGFGATTDKTTTDSHRKLRLGEWKGGFPINGSTVISYYLPNDFAVLPKVAEYKKAVVTGEGVDRAEIELKANMGDPLLIKKEVLYAQVVERCSSSLTPTATVESVKEEIRKLDVMGRKLPTDSKQARYFEHDQEVLGKIQVLLKKDKLTIDEQEMLKKFEAIIEKRIAVLQQNVTIAEQTGVNLKDVEVGKIATAEAVTKAVVDLDKMEVKKSEGRVDVKDMSLDQMMDESDLATTIINRAFEEIMKGLAEFAVS